MSGHLNNRESKREKQFNSHNRKPGMAKFWKHKRNRHARRVGHRINTYMTEERTQNDSSQ